MTSIRNIKEIETVNIKETKNALGLRLVIIEFNFKPVFEADVYTYVFPKRRYVKSEGTEWMEAKSNKYKHTSFTENMILNEFCSHKGIVVPRS